MVLIAQLLLQQNQMLHALLEKDQVLEIQLLLSKLLTKVIPHFNKRCLDTLACGPMIPHGEENLLQWRWNQSMFQQVSTCLLT